MIYADYAYYTANYLLGKPSILTEEIFPYYSKMASSKMDLFTFGNTCIATVILDEMKDCCCEIAELLITDEASQSGIVSENNDGYSITYDVARDSNVKIKEIIHNRLLMTGLLYRGGAFL